MWGPALLRAAARRLHACSSSITQLQQQQAAAARLLGTSAATLAAQPALADDALAAKCAAALSEIQQAGTFKQERQIVTPQAASVGACCVCNQHAA